MIGNGFGNAGLGGGDFESLARQYWSAWGEALRQGTAGAGQPGWQQASQWWAQLLPGLQPQATDAVQRFQQLANGWYGQMQQLAAQFAGQGGSAADIAGAWREAMAAQGAQANPFAEIFRTLHAGGQESLGQWLEQAGPYIEALQNLAGSDATRWLHAPTFGLAREHQERWQGLAQAQQDYQRCHHDYNALMAEVMRSACSLFESKLAEREEPGRQLNNARALFDLWIDAAEEAYTEAALSESFRQVYGALTNAQMRLRGAVQVEIEKVCGLFGMPTRTEVDSAHRKIVQLERALRQATRQAAARPAARRPAAPVAEPEPKPAAQASRPQPPASKPATAVVARTKARPPARRAPAATKAKPAARAKPRKPAAPRRAAASRAATPSKRAAPKPSAPAKAGKSASVQKPAKAAKPAKGNIVSMKDWVARYAAPAPLAAPGPGKGKRGERT